MGKIAIGENYLLIGGFSKSVHAEPSAILKYYHMMKKKGRMPRRNAPISGTLYSIRISKTSVLGNARPCANCIEFIKKAAEKLGIIVRDVVYTTSNGCVSEIFAYMFDSPLTHVSSGTRHLNNIRTTKRRKNKLGN